MMWFNDKMGSDSKPKWGWRGSVCAPVHDPVWGFWRLGKNDNVKSQIEVMGAWFLLGDWLGYSVVVVSWLICLSLIWILWFRVVVVCVLPHARVLITFAAYGIFQFPKRIGLFLLWWSWVCKKDSPEWIWTSRAVLRLYASKITREGS